MKVLRFRERKRRRRGRVDFPKQRAWEIDQISFHRYRTGTPVVEPAAYLLPMARTYRDIIGDNVDLVAQALCRWAVVHRFTFEPQEIQLAADTAVSTPRFMSSEELAAMLQLTYAERQEIGVYSIGACDKTKAERKQLQAEAKQQRDREGQEVKRREAGIPTRAEYLASVKTKAATHVPEWKAAGASSKTTYYRNMAATRGTGVNRYVQKEGYPLVSDAPQSHAPPPAAQLLKWLPMTGVPLIIIPSSTSVIAESTA
jgi:hypothetical protein